MISRRKLAVMSEATSTLDKQGRATIQVVDAKQVMFVSVGHQTTVTAHHELQLQLQPVTKSKEMNGKSAQSKNVQRAAA